MKTHRGGLEEWLVVSNRIFLRFLVGRLRVLADDGKSKSVAVSSSSVCFSGVNISPFYPYFRSEVRILKFEIAELEQNLDLSVFFQK